MGNESPELLALIVIIRLIDDELAVYSTAMTDSQKKLYYAIMAHRDRLQAEIAALESNTTK